MSAAILVNGLIRDPWPTGAGALIILAGIPVYSSLVAVALPSD